MNPNSPQSTPTIEPLIVDTTEKLSQLIEWLYKAAEIVSYKRVFPNGINPADDDSDYEEDDSIRPITIHEFKLDKTRELELDNEDDLLIPVNDLYLESFIDLALPLAIENNRGINHDKRGTKNDHNEFLEFRDFYAKWDVPAGPITIHDFLRACYKVKSHKFENWYEWVQGAKCTIKDGRFYADLQVDHGS